MSTYLLDARTSLKNKLVERVLMEDDPKLFFMKKNLNHEVLDNIIQSHIDRIFEGNNFYNTTDVFSKIDKNDLAKTLDLNEKDKEFLDKLLSKNSSNKANVNDFLNFYKEKFMEAIKKDETKTYNLVGSLTNTINKFSKKGFIKRHDMDKLVVLINNEKGINQKDIVDYPNEIKLIIKNLISDDDIKIYTNESHNKTKKQETLNFLMSNMETLNNNFNQTDNPEYQRTHIDNFFSNLEISGNDNLYLKEYNIKLKEKLVNNGIPIKNIEINQESIKYREIENNIKTFLNYKYSNQEIEFNEAKEFFLLSILDKKELFKYLSNVNTMKKIKRMELFSKIEIDDNLLLIPKEYKDKLQTIKNIINLSEKINDLGGTNLNINVSSTFYEKFGVDIDSKNGKEYLKTIFNTYEEFKDLVNNNSNILLMVIIESFIIRDNLNRPNKENIKNLLDILNTDKKELSNEQKENLNKLDNNWLKWSLVFKKEIDEPLLYNSEINPLNFEFNEYKGIVKLINNDEMNLHGEEPKLTKEKLEIYQVAKELLNDDVSNKIYIRFMNSFKPETEIESNTLKEFLNRTSTKISLDNLNETLSFMLNGYSNSSKNGKDEFYRALTLFNTLNNKLEKDNLNYDLKLSDFIFLKNQNVVEFKLLNEIPNMNKNQIDKLSEILPKINKITNSTHGDSYKAKVNIMEAINFFDKRSVKNAIANYDENKVINPIINYTNQDKSIKTLSIKDSEVIFKIKLNNVGANQRDNKSIINSMIKNPNYFNLIILETDENIISNSIIWTKNKQLTISNIDISNKYVGSDYISNDAKKMITNEYKEYALLALNNSNIDRVIIGNTHDNYFNDKHIGYINNFTVDAKNPEITINDLVKSPFNLNVGEYKNQRILFSLNTIDLSSKKFNEHQVYQLSQHDKKYDGSNKAIKEFLENYNKELVNLSQIKNYDELLGNQKDKFIELLDKYNIQNGIKKEFNFNHLQ